MIGSEVVERIDSFTYLGSFISTDGMASDEFSTRIQNARMAFANWHHLWLKQDTRLPNKGWIYYPVVCSVLRYRCKTCLLGIADNRRLLVFGQMYLQNIPHIFWNQRISNVWIRNRVLGKIGKPTDEVINFHQLRWFQCVTYVKGNQTPRSKNSS